jgi:hypothetical protein
MKNLDKRGGKGMLHMLLPPPGGEGVTLLGAAENARITLKKRVSSEPYYPKKNHLIF